ncbi:hypothetical protein P43SY_009710 [Pythium insidiosum]|uniref:Protein kinase domain-containing protein n=1 Tax=Pythium insidiosum TaxID=114742 RepID=A0AAD5Q8L3_PYTIN|nr:hypothetical protein P43SY_009710 [Pythium insidiosum]
MDPLSLTTLAEMTAASTSSSSSSGSSSSSCGDGLREPSMSPAHDDITHGKNSLKRRPTINDRMRRVMGDMISEDELQAKFTFGRVLGSGATSQVYAARDNKTGEQVAVKVFDKAAMIEVRRSMAADGQFVTEKAVHRVRRRLLKVLSELEISKSLDHPNIIKFLGAYETSHRICLVHELASGVFRQLLSALQYCHARNVCHRDLKLENVLITKDLQVKLIDFGLSEVVPAGTTLRTISGTTLRTICGTPLYCAPEVLFLHSSTRETGFHGAPADVWSVGILIFALLTGCAPFDDSSFAKLRHDVNRNRIAYPAYLSNEVKGMLKLMLIFDPVLRPSITDLLDYSWLQQRGPEPTAASPVASPTAKRARERSLSGVSENGTDTTASTSGSFDNDETAALHKITEEPQHRPEISLPTHLSCLERELEQLLTTAS